ncbi:MAG: hypothetical protein COV67_15025 [Nitrospinae bacterium CG11_big_fil_rev_8_21_14_0_20_56_8]|nr:MAG: hypothetical protein COV67_15025 [Nitrospinae bacterium CG11_big_fil_rev_8_21_14_0_20_56_8]
MKKILFFTLICFVSFVVSAQAKEVKTGESVSCKDAKSIEISVAQIAGEFNDKNGYTSNDRGTANLVVWKSSNFTTVPLTLGPADNNMSVVGADQGHTGLAPRGSMGKDKVVLTHQPEFSRGDSIGDISGEVRITNTGTNAVNIDCM